MVREDNFGSQMDDDVFEDSEKIRSPKQGDEVLIVIEGDCSFFTKIEKISGENVILANCIIDDIYPIPFSYEVPISSLKVDERDTHTNLSWIVKIKKT